MPPGTATRSSRKRAAGGDRKACTVTATPGPVPGSVEWTTVTAQDPGHTIYFSPAPAATHYRIYFASLESQLTGRRPLAAFVEADASPHVREDIPVTTALFYRVFPMNDSRIGVGGPVAVSPSRIVSEHALGVDRIAGAAFGIANDDDCLDLPTALGSVNSGRLFRKPDCTGTGRSRPGGLDCGAARHQRRALRRL